jgi:L-threonylcarbamoyladenylate synthase
MSAVLAAADAVRLEGCLAAGGVAVFPADTVYGVCCDPDDARAARRLYELKGRPPERPAAVMFFALEAALAGLPELEAAEREVLRALLPGAVTLLLPNRARRFAPACAGDAGTLGLRVPLLSEPLRALAGVRAPAMQSSANVSGEPDARVLAEVPLSLREGADLVLDGGKLPGTPSTVIDLRAFAADGSWSVVREGALASAAVAELLEPLR